MSEHYFAGHDLKSASRIIRHAKMVHRNWYWERYPDVAALGMEPAEHYLKYGAAMGRDPGRGFDTDFYLETYPEVAERGLNPLLHYVLEGREKGYRPRPQGEWTEQQAERRIAELRTKLLSLGFTERPLAELSHLLEKGESPLLRSMASRELALWHMRLGTQDGYRTALEHIVASRDAAPSLDFRCRLTTVELLCHYFLEDAAAGEACYRQRALLGEASTDALLARVNFEESAEGRCLWINQVLRRYGLLGVRLSEEDDLPPYDRLSPAEALPPVTEGPKVTVLLAAYDAAAMLPTALRSLQEQTWQNLEILVIDDCSPDDGATCAVAERFAAQDDRIRLIRMERNGGAYVARNRGLDEATGEFVTIHDADDWSHPMKIETQARFLIETPEVMGCTSEQARATGNLCFPKWAGARGSIRIIKENVSSFMARHTQLKENIGYWDTVRFGADSEKMRRIRHVHGEAAVVSLPTGPLSFQRISESSIVSDGAFGVDGFFFGARKEYMEAQIHHLETAASARHEGGTGTGFPVPAVMHPERAKTSKHFDVIIASDYRMHGGSVRSCVEEILCQQRMDLRTGLLQMYRYDYPVNGKRMLPEVRELLDGDATRVVTFGEEVSCDLLLIRYPPVLQEKQRYLPKIDAGEIKVIVNQPPMSDYTETGMVRYEIPRAKANLRAQFGKDATWYPIGPLMREALETRHPESLGQITLSETDWYNVIDLEGWYRESSPRAPGDRLRIGRHSRDSFVKWPASREDLRAIYPDEGDVEVRVLGGAETPVEILGHRPANWKVFDFGSMNPREFLSSIDVFVYYTHPDWVEAFGRSIIEAMAVGVPVILPEVYRPLFGEGAVYAAPQEVIPEARRLKADPEAYARQVEKGRDLVHRTFSYEAHERRLREVLERERAAAVS